MTCQPHMHFFVVQKCNTPPPGNRGLPSPDGMPVYVTHGNYQKAAAYCLRRLDARKGGDPLVVGEEENRLVIVTITADGVRVGLHMVHRGDLPSKYGPDVQKYIDEWSPTEYEDQMEAAYKKAMGL